MAAVARRRLHRLVSVESPVIICAGKGTGVAAGKLPVLKGRQVVAALERAGFVIVGGTKHTKLRGPAGQIVVIPNHPGEDVKPGTLRHILRQAGLSPEDFLSRV